MKPYTLKVRGGGVEVDSRGKKAGKGVLIQENLASTLAVSQDQYLFAVENHPADSRCDIDDSGTVQTLTGRMGTGGNNTPMVMYSKSTRARSSEDATIWKASQVTNTLNTFDVGETRTNEVVAYCAGNGQADQLQLYDKVNTLDCMHDQKMMVIGIDRAAYNQGVNAHYEPQYDDNLSSTVVAKGPAAVAYGVDCRNALESETSGALQHDSYKSLNSNNVCRQGYIVRRLTPLEWSRLQGFPDGWGDISHKDTLTDEEYDFWSAIHPGTREQVLRWYNKLHTDSAEYKMWGNGIALPCALYVFEGIEKELRLAHETPDSHL